MQRCYCMIPPVPPLQSRRISLGYMIANLRARTTYGERHAASAEHSCTVSYRCTYYFYLYKGTYGTSPLTTVKKAKKTAFLILIYHTHCTQPWVPNLSMTQQHCTGYSTVNDVYDVPYVIVFNTHLFCTPFTPGRRTQCN